MGNEMTVRVVITSDPSGAITGLRKVQDAQEQFHRQDAHVKQQMAASWQEVALAAAKVAAAWATVTRVILPTMRYLSTIETASLGIAAAFMTGGQYVDATTGKVLKGYDALKAAQGESRELIRQLQYANLQTIATLDELIVAYQQTLPVALAKGFDKKQVMEFTVAMVQAAGAIGLPMNQLGEETRSLLTGAINPRNSRIATVLGLTNEDVNQFQGNASAMFGFLMQKLDAYKIAGIEAQNTWAGLWSNTKDIVLQFLGQGMEPLFEAIKYELQTALKHVVTLDESTKTIQWNPEFLNGINSLKAAITVVVADTYRLGMLLDKIGGTLTTIGYVGSLGLSKSMKEKNTMFEERYKASERALMDMAMRQEGYKSATKETPGAIDQATPYGQTLWYVKEIAKETKYKTNAVREDAEIEKEAAKQRQKSLEGYAQSWGAFAEERIQENETLAKYESDALKKGLAEEDAAREYSRGKWAEYYQWEIDERNRVIVEGYDKWLEAEKRLLGIRKEQQDLQFASNMTNMQDAFGAIGASDLGRNVGMLGAIAAEQDPYTQDFNRWKVLQDEKYSYMAALGASEQEWKTALAEEELQREAMQQQQKIAVASAGFGMMAGVAQAFYNASGKQSLAAFRAYQAFSIGEAIIGTYRAAVSAYAFGTKYGGPYLGAAFAAAAIAAGLAQVRAIASQKPGGGAAVSVPSGEGIESGGSNVGLSSPAAPAPAAASKPATIINVHVYNNAAYIGVDPDEMARDLVPRLTKAYEDGVR